MATKDGNGAPNASNAAAGGRGRGRGLASRAAGGGDDDHQQQQWSRNQDGNHRGSNDLWDSSTDSHNHSISAGFDLSDFAAAATKFQESTRNILKENNIQFSGEDNYAEMKKNEDDLLARLTREQSLEGDEDVSSEVIEGDDDDEELPDWAIEGDKPTNGAKPKHEEIKSSAKSNLLLSVSM